MRARKISVKNAAAYACIMAMTVILSACYPGGAEFIDELDVVSTNYDEDFDFASQLTYSLPDCVIEIDDNDFGNPGGELPECISDLFSDEILAKIRENMSANGFTEVDEDDDPDIVFLVSAMETTTLYYFYDPSWWWWYYPGWGPGWGWGYPYPPAYISGYTSGTIFMQMSDPDGIVDDQVPVHWNGIINGLLQGSNTNILNRIDRNVDQAFEQSPYLRK